MEKLLSISLSAALLFVLGQCQQKADPSPSGANTFSCQIEGDDFTPYLAPILITPQKALRANTTNSTGFAIEAKTTTYDLVIYVVSIQATGTYSLAYASNSIPYKSNPDSYASCTITSKQNDPNNPVIETDYYTNNTNVGTVTFTRFDTVARVAGGTFEYTAREATTGKLVHVTNGKFDVKF